MLGGIYHGSNEREKAKSIREEAYMHVNETYNPEHPLVLEAAGQLIGTLLNLGDFYNAERFARICYDALIRPPLDPKSYEAAKAAGNLANASRFLIQVVLT
jgi:hypothetical protein